MRRPLLFLPLLSLLLLLGACANRLPPHDPHQAWIDLHGAAGSQVGADSLNDQHWPDRRYFQVSPGEHSLQTRVGFEVSSSNLGRDDQEVRRTCILQVDYDGFTAGQRYQLEARPYGFRAMARLRDSSGQVVARGRLVRCGI